MEDSVTARQRICNFCVSAEVSRAEADRLAEEPTRLDLDAIR